MAAATAFLVPGFPADESDATCLPAVQNYVAAFARLHPDRRALVVAFQYPFEPRSYTWKGLPVYSAGGANRGGPFKIKTWLRAYGALRRFSPNLVHSFWIGECALVGSWISAVHGCAHVATIGGQELRNPTPYSRILVRRRLLLGAGSPLASHTARQSLGRPADAIIPLGLDVEHFTLARGPRDIDVLGVGSLIPVKRYDVLVEAARRNPSRSFVLVGNGPLYSELARTAPKNLTLRGALPRPEVIRLMQRSDVLLHPSEFESQGYVFLEALASGMHVVCRDVGAPGSSSRVHVCSDDHALILQTERTLAGRVADDRSPPHRRARPSAECSEDGVTIEIPSAEDSVRAYEELYRRALRENLR